MERCRVVVLLAAWLGFGVVACASESDVDVAGGGFEIDTGGGGAGRTTATTTAGGGTAAVPAVPDDVPAALATAIDATRAVESADLRFVAGLEAPDQVVTTGMDGQMSSHGLGHVEAEVEGGGTALALELLTGGGTTWVSMDLPRFREALPDGAQWVEVPPGRLAGVVPEASLEQTWPVLAVLRGVDEVEDMGSQDVAGTPVRMLRGEVDPGAALVGATADERASMERMVELPGRSPDLMAQVGLDGEGRIRYLEVVATTTGADGDGGRATATTELEVRAFNQILDLPPEPEDGEAVPLAAVPEVEDVLTGDR